MTVGCYQKAIELLAGRPHFRAELGVKLGRRGYGAEEVEGVLARLEKQGLIDDVAAARGLMERLGGRSGGVGRRRVRAELVRRGADGAAIELVVGEMPEDDGVGARQAAAQWRRRHGGKEGGAALARHLERRGFSRRAIFSVLELSEGTEGLEE